MCWIVLHCQNKPIDLNKLHNIVENYGEIYLTNDDKLKHDLQFDHWFESNFAFGVSFILLLIGTIDMLIAIATYIKSHKATALMAAFWKADTTEGRIIDHSVTDDVSCETDILFIRIVFHLCVTICLFLMFHLLKRYFKSCQLAKILLPTEDTGTETTVLIEFNCGKAYCIYMHN